MNKQIKVTWIIPIVILSGIFGFLTTRFNYFEFKKEIDVLNLITLIVTTCVGVYIATTLQKTIDASKFEKELVFDLIKPLRTTIKKLIKWQDNNYLRFTETKLIFKEISNLLHELEEINESCSTIDSNDLDFLRAEYLTIKRLVTGANIENGKFKLSIENKPTVKLQLKNLSTRLTELLITINRK